MMAAFLFVFFSGVWQEREKRFVDPAPALVDTSTNASAAVKEAASTGDHRWIHVDPPDVPTLLGLSTKTARAMRDASGFRVEQRILAPSEPYEIQQHEVTCGEFESWIRYQKLEFHPPAWLLQIPEDERRDLPVTGFRGRPRKPIASGSVVHCQPRSNGNMPREVRYDIRTALASHRGEARRSMPIAARVP